MDNNVWVVGDENEVLVVDAAHDADEIAEAVGGRRVVAVVCTHAHDDHVNPAPALADRFNAPILLNPAEAPLWEMTHPNRKPDRELADGDVLTRRRHRTARAGHPGPLARLDLPLRPRAEAPYSPGTPCSPVGRGRPGARSPRSRTIIDSIRDRLLTLPGDTTVRTGHGDSTTIGAETPQLEEWIARGH